MRRQVIRRIYMNWLDDKWPELLMKFAKLRPDDYGVFAAAQYSMPTIQVLEKAKVLMAVEKAFAAGLIEYPEARAEAGYSTDDIETIIERVNEQKELLGPQGGGSGPPPADDNDSGNDDDEDDDKDKDGAKNQN